MNPATELARELVAELVGAGVGHVVLCPGSRSAPLAYALYDLGRRAGVAARAARRAGGRLHRARHRAGDRRPAAVVTTSGTAVANLHPAVLEAHHAGVPLLVLAADRPARLRGTWANQTCDLQAGLSAPQPRFAADLRPGRTGWGGWVARSRGRPWPRPWGRGAAADRSI